MQTRPRAHWVAASALLVVAVFAAGSARADAAVYKAQGRPAAELLPLAEAAMAGRGSAVLDAGTNSIVLLGSAEAVREALTLVEGQDQPARTVIIRYEERRIQDLDSSGMRVLWSTGSGSVRVGNVVAPTGGTRVFFAPHATDRTGNSRQTGTLRVLDGQAGRISTGQIVPVTTRRRPTRFGIVTDSMRVAADTGFEVRPRVLSEDRVKLEFTPFGATVRPDGSIATSGAATTVVLDPSAEMAVVGGIGSEVSSTTSGLSGRSATQARDERILLVGVEIE